MIIIIIIIIIIVLRLLAVYSLYPTLLHKLLILFSTTAYSVLLLYKLKLLPLAASANVYVHENK